MFICSFDKKRKVAPAAMFADANQILGYLSGYHETNVCVTRTLISFCVKVWRWRPLFGARVFFANLSINYSTATSSWPQPSLLILQFFNIVQNAFTPPLSCEHLVYFFDGLGGTLHCSKNGQLDYIRHRSKETMSNIT